MEKENVTAVYWLAYELDLTLCDFTKRKIKEAQEMEAEQRLKDFNAGAQEERKRSKSDEMLEMLEIFESYFVGKQIDEYEYQLKLDLKQLIKEATEI